MCSPSLGSDDGGHTLLFEPPKETAKFGSQDIEVREAAEQRLQRVEHDPLGPDGVNRMAQANKQSFEVVLPRFLDLAPLDVNVVHRQFLFLDEVIKIEAERTDVLSQFFRGFLERKKHARLVVQHGSPNQELDAHECFAAAGAAAHQRGSAFGKPAARDLVQSRNASLAFWQTRGSGRFLFRDGLGQGTILPGRLLTPPCQILAKATTHHSR